MKNKNLKAFAIVALVSISVLRSNAQQLKVPAPSPLQTIDQAFALSSVKVEYSRPSVKGRVIFGDLIPYGKMWRTGANASTKFTFGDDVTVEGKAINAGTYALYTIPGQGSWDLIFYKGLTLGGNFNDYKPSDEVLRFTVKTTALPEKVETFTINIADITATSANVELLWEKTKVAFKLVSEIDSKIMKNIEANVMKDARPYQQAASYFYDNNKDLNKALEWSEKAIEQNPKYYVVHLKAKIQMKLKDYQGAIATAEKSLALAKTDNADDYIRLNEKLIEEAKKAK
jgi:tetratricopeptide (TPR) repeat protein